MIRESGSREVRVTVKCGDKAKSGTYNLRKTQLAIAGFGDGRGPQATREEASRLGGHHSGELRASRRQEESSEY